MTPVARTGLAFPGPVRFLSDLHLGHDMCSLRSTAELWPLIEGAGTVVFNGDTTEEGTPEFFSRSQDMYGQLRELCARAGAQMICLNGNHDPERWPHDWFDLADGKLFVTHGHVFLRLISPWTRKLKFCRAELERIHREYSAEQRRDMNTRFEIARRCSVAMPPCDTGQRSHNFATRMALLLREIWPPTRPWEVLKVWARLPALAGEFVREFRPGARAVLFGHTHRAVAWRRNGRLLVNTGGFVTFAQPLLAELKDETLSVFRVEDKKGERRRGGQVTFEVLEN
ncbi:MAG TPA: metallophosphoesterase [Verrucomicrobiales bacterium]|nr:metallophosphoesterase [Verrucomicrobiales bacterium]